jgi:hypothetical protein
MHEKIPNPKHQITKPAHRFLTGKSQNPITKITNEKTIPFGI